VVGEILRAAGVTTIGVTSTVFTRPREGELHTITSFLAPAVEALKMYVYTQEASAASTAVQLVATGSFVRSGPLGKQDRSVRSPAVVTVTNRGTL
jgi:hypothetical protein